LAFQFHIRQHTDASDRGFGEGDVRTYDAEQVRVGRAPECECRVDASEFRDVHFTILCSPKSNHTVCYPAAGAEVYLGEELLRSEHEVLSGDEIRVAHYTFRVQRLFRPASRGIRFGLLSIVAKALVGLILVVEVTIATWLPYQVRATSRLQHEVTRQRILFRLDYLRATVGGMTLTGGLEEAACRLVEEELRTLSRYLRESEQRLSREEWGQVANDLESYNMIMCALRDNTALPPLLEVDVEAGVRAALKGATEF